MRALRLLGAREFRGESSIEFRMTKTGFFAWLCILACVGALDSLIIIFSVIFMSIYSGSVVNSAVYSGAHCFYAASVQN